MSETTRKYIDSTIDYYNEYAHNFVGSTVDVDFSMTQDLFLSKLEQGSHILDFGCGSGRDTKYFLERGYQVTAIDGSIELCRLASGYTGIPVRHMFFQELEDRDIYEGIWACSSVLHLPLPELEDVFLRMKRALKRKGVIYASFKYGNYEGERGGRYFTDMTEDRLSSFMSKAEGLKAEEQWVSKDIRPGRGDERWLNIILRKI